MVVSTHYPAFTIKLVAEFALAGDFRYSESGSFLLFLFVCIFLVFYITLSTNYLLLSIISGCQLTTITYLLSVF